MLINVDELRGRIKERLDFLNGFIPPTAVFNHSPDVRNRAEACKLELEYVLKWIDELGEEFHEEGD